ncbi:MAG TPA: DUF559 domain-containing protein [bacterium]|nr:DUF559 domain-containing protein [bacterium]
MTFRSASAKLIVELDGGQHALDKERDDERTRFLARGGFRVVRFWNHEVLGIPRAVLTEMPEKILRSPSPRPSPLEGEGGKKRNQTP